MQNTDKSPQQKRFLIGQLGSFGDCLYATTIARQIKFDYPDCHLTWAVGSIYKTILYNNPHVDEIWEIPLSKRSDLLNCWQKFEDEAIKRKNKGDFDEVFFTQVLPNNLKNFDGTLRSSQFRAYNRPITVPVSPVLHLSVEEIENVRHFAESHNLINRKNVILFECSPKSNQSFITLDFALDVSREIVNKIPDTCVILSTNEPLSFNYESIIDGSVLSFRENAELTKYCTLLVGCSSGISWLCTSNWAKPLPMIQLLKKSSSVYASIVHDHEYQGIPTDSVIEMTECSPNELFQCINLIANHQFILARNRYHEKINVNFIPYASTIDAGLIQRKRYKDTLTSLKITMKRYGPRPQIFISLLYIIIRNRCSRLFQIIRREC